MGKLYRVPYNSGGLNYNKCFRHDDVERSTLTEFNSSNTESLDVAVTEAKVVSLTYTQEILKGGKK